MIFYRIVYLVNNKKALINKGYFVTIVVGIKPTFIQKSPKQCQKALLSYSQAPLILSI